MNEQEFQTLLKEMPTLNADQFERLLAKLSWIAADNREDPAWHHTHCALKQAVAQVQTREGN